MVGFAISELFRAFFSLQKLLETLVALYQLSRWQCIGLSIIQTIYIGTAAGKNKLLSLDYLILKMAEESVVFKGAGMERMEIRSRINSLSFLQMLIWVQGSLL